MSTPITAGTQLALDRAILSPDGEVVEETEAGHPFRCQFGNSELPPGLERELDGKSLGHEFEITLSAEEAFGVHDPAQVISLPRAELPDGARAVRVDVSDEAAVEQAFAEALEAFGRVDGCFANAGVGGAVGS